MCEAPNCCSASTGTLDGWECLVLGTPCVPVYSPNIAPFSIATYGTSSAAQVACDASCVPINPIWECDDCDDTLGPMGTNQLSAIPSNQMGAWVNTVTYDIDDCVYDTSTANANIVQGCCYCCVNYGPNIGGGCDAGFTPSLHINIDIGGAMWVACGYDAGGNQAVGCVPVIQNNECEDCSLDLSNTGYLPPGTTVTFPYPPPILWGANMGFWIGQCVYDVDPFGSGELCCWCCACPGGYSVQDGECLPFGPAMQSASPESAPSSTVPPDCAIDASGVTS